MFNVKTLKQVRDALKVRGLVITRTEYDEYRVNFRGGREGTAYYTTDLEDALDTGHAMADRRAPLTTPPTPVLP